MPATAAAALFALLLAPGFLMVRGYARRRYQSQPDRDVFAVAEAVVASALWLAAVWLFLLLLGDPIRTWGVVPWSPHLLNKHRGDTVALGLAVILLPYGVGAVSAAGADFIGSRTDRFLRLSRWVGFLRTPTAWDRAWLRFQRQGAGEVVIRLKDGSLIRGGYGRGAQVDLSPKEQQVFLVEGYRYAEGDRAGHVEPGENPNGEAEAVEYGSAGVFIAPAEIAAIYFKEQTHDARPQRPAHTEPEGLDNGDRGSSRRETQDGPETPES